MRQFAEKYGTVLVVGGEGEKCRLVAESYGFRDVITPGDILKTNAATAPFRKLTEQEHADSRDLRERGPLSNVVIDAIFVFADSRDCKLPPSSDEIFDSPTPASLLLPARVRDRLTDTVPGASDVQIIIDIAMSKGGRLETRSETFEEGPPIYFSHNDIVYVRTLPTLLHPTSCQLTETSQVGCIARARAPRDGCPTPLRRDRLLRRDRRQEAQDALVRQAAGQHL